MVYHQITINTAITDASGMVDIYQDEFNSHILIIRLVDNGKFYNVSGYRPRIEFIDPETEKVITSDCVSVINGYRGYLSYILGESIVKTIGRYTVSLVLDKLDTSDVVNAQLRYTFIINVVKNDSDTHREPDAEVIKPESYYTELDKHLEVIDTDLADHESRIRENSSDIASLESRMTSAETDIDNLEIKVPDAPETDGDYELIAHTYNNRSAEDATTYTWEERQTVTANPVLSGEESDLDSIEINGTNYKVLTDTYTKGESDSRYAQKNGSYPNMEVGTADSAKGLEQTIYATDNEPYIFREVPSIGDATGETNTIIGGSVVWNQLMDCVNNSSSAQYGAISNKTTNGFTFTRSTSTATWSRATIYFPGAVAGHKYLVRFVAKTTTITPSASIRIRVYWETNSSANSLGEITYSSNTKTEFLAYSTLPADATHIYINFPSQTSSVTDITEFCVYDITKMFQGSPIYSSLSSISNILWLNDKGFFKYLSYAPDMGSIHSVQISSHSITGINQWDEEWELGAYSVTGQESESSTTIRSTNAIECLPITTYYAICNKSFHVFFYSGSDTNTFISSATVAPSASFVTPEHANYFRFYVDSSYGTEYNNNICFSLNRVSQYHRYQRDTYPIDSNVILRGIYSKSSSYPHNLEIYFGDEYTSDGKVVHKFNQITVTGNAGDPITLPGLDRTRTYGILTTAGPYWDGIMEYGDDSDFILLVDVVDLGIMYPLKESEYITETAEPFKNPVPISNEPGCTEEFVGIYPYELPVGHESSYINYDVDRIERSPDIPYADGKYLVEYDSAEGIVSYEPYTIPDVPTDTDATYYLTAIVVDGVVTYQWTPIE